MITNQNMIRKMGNFDVTQRTKDGFFNATALLEQWNKSNPNEKRALDNFWKSTNLDKLMLEIVINEPYLLEKSSSVNSTYDKNVFENQQVLNTQNSGYLKNSTKNQQVFKSVVSTELKYKDDFKGLKNIVAKTARGKHNGGTWLHPVMFVKFAMYLSPRFEYHVLRFVADEMIKYRNLAGDSYKELCSAVSKLVPKDFVVTAIRKVAEALNYIVFGDHKNGIRNDFGEEQKQQELWEFQRKVTSLINEGFISTFESLVDYLRTSYKNKHLPKVFN